MALASSANIGILVRLDISEAMSTIELGAALYRMFGVDGLRGGIFTDEQIDAFKAEGEASADRARIPEADRKFAEHVARHILEWEGNDGRFLVVTPGPMNGYLHWLRNDIVKRINPYKVTQDRITYLSPRGWYLEIDLLSEDRIRNGAQRGRAYDDILLHDDVTWRTFQAIAPCLVRRKSAT